MNQLLGRVGAALALAGVSLSAAAAGGCAFQEALADGLYGGVSDTIAGAISTVALRVFNVGQE
ncbi:hypothetical protein RAS1_10120 [Phycisphaerae bacterium RAS1]|nr:hypothetical protein RAS1_10120 [Phycisphaerae bacterium RAS1]